MKKMSSAEVRRAFLDFFEEMGHRALASSSLVPADDPTLLFANSGMVQFKDVFLGLDRRDYSRATTSQKCMRVSGKHNDLENVGPSPRHHTFFEMLGNFSFGDYFKRDAIRFAFDLLTEVYGLPAERLAVTVYENDDESYDCWVKEIGINPRRVARMGPSTNFWQMADTGPCGPNSEIHWDKFPEQGDEDVIALLQAEDDRFLEIWNLVFMQFNRQQADPEHTGKWDAPLPAPGVDTGMGFERILTILQGVEANYETDLFTPIIRRTQALTGHSDEQRDADIVPYRVIADHIRAAVFLISDGVMPGAKGRAAIPRIVIRRAARFGREIGFERPFLADIADTVIDIMGGHYSELVAGAETIKRVITLEEERFLRTMDRGLNELDDMLAQLDDSMELSGQQAFYLKATLGLPYQVTKDVAEERGFSVDEAGFAEAEAEHALISGGGTAMGEIASAEAYRQLLTDLQAAGALPAEGVRYDPYTDSPADTEILALMREGRPVDSALVGEAIEFVLGETRFYVEAGGQVSDTGTVSGAGWVIEVEAMKQPVSGLIVHVGEVVEGAPARGDSASAQVDRSRRMDITRNHTATHLLHAALRNKLGRHVQQRGSLVAPDRLRFDFSHPEKVTERELSAVAAEISGAIARNASIRCIGRALHAVAREHQRDRPVAAVGVLERALDRGLDFFGLVDEAVRDAESVQDGCHGLGVVVAPPVLLAPFAPVTHRHHHGHGVLESQAGYRLAALSDPGVFHDHQRPTAGEVSAGADPRHVAFVRDLDVTNRVVRRAQAIDAREQRLRQRGHDADIRLLQPLHEQPGIFGNRVDRHEAFPSAFSRKLSAKAWPRSRAFFFITPSPNLPSRPNTETSDS